LEEEGKGVFSFGGQRFHLYNGLFFFVFTTFLISRSSLSTSLFDGKDIQKLEKTFLFTVAKSAKRTKSVSLNRFLNCSKFSCVKLRKHTYYL
jgi:hypothetical protein